MSLKKSGSGWAMCGAAWHVMNAWRPRPEMDVRWDPLCGGRGEVRIRLDTGRRECATCRKISESTGLGKE